MDTPGPFEKRATEAYYYVTPTENDWPEKQKEEWLTAFNYYTSDIDFDSRSLSWPLCAVSALERIVGEQSGKDFRQLRLH